MKTSGQLEIAISAYSRLFYQWVEATAALRMAEQQIIAAYMGLNHPHIHYQLDTSGIDVILHVLGASREQEAQIQQEIEHFMEKVNATCEHAVTQQQHQKNSAEPEDESLVDGPEVDEPLQRIRRIGGDIVPHKYDD